MPTDPAYEPTPISVGNGVEAVDEVFEHYRILRKDDGSLWKLGEGAMGATYKAIDKNLDKLVALKIINAQFLSKESSRQRFRREARVAASLHHRHIAGVYHLGEREGKFFYSMEFVDGQTVERLIKDGGALPWAEALRLTLQITRALIAAHAKGLVHRDIKPANIMVVDEADEQSVARLIDFGLAKSVPGRGRASDAISKDGGFFGTPPYMSPEQWEELPADMRSDIYSLGMTLWHMLTGRPPFRGNLASLLHQHMHVAPPWEKLPADLPPSVRKLMEWMLAKSPDARPQTPADLRAAIEACLRAPVAEPPPTTATPPPAAATPPTPAPPAPTPPLPKKRIKITRLTGETVSLPKDGEGVEVVPESEPLTPRESIVKRFWTGSWGHERVMALTAILMLTAAAGVFGWLWIQEQYPPGVPTSAAASPPPGASSARPAQTVPAPLPSGTTGQPTAAPSPGLPPKVAPTKQAKIALAQGYIKSALSEAGGIVDAIEKFSALRDVAGAQAKAGDVEGAYKTVGGIADATVKSSALRAVAAAQARAGDMEGAYKTISGITQAYDKVWALCAVAEAQAKGGNVESSRRTLAAAVRTTEAITDSTSRDFALKGLALRYVARGQAKAGILDEAYKTADSISTVGILRGYNKALALLVVAEEQARAGNAEAGRKSLATSLLATENMGSNFKAVVLQGIAKVQAKAGDVLDSERTLDLISPGKDKVIGYAGVAKTLLAPDDEAVED